MPSRKNNRRYHSINKPTTSSVYDVERRMTIAVIIIILLMFAFTPFIIIYNNDNNNTNKSESYKGSNNGIDAVISNSNSDILTTPSQSTVEQMKNNEINSIVTNHIGKATKDIINDSIYHLRLHN